MHGSWPTWTDSGFSIVSLFANFNQFTGTLPSFTALPQFALLEIMHNRFYGEIGDAFVNMTNMGTFWFAGNNFTGLIPDYVFYNGYSVDMSFNSFQTLPDTISSPTNMFYLDLSNNPFEEQDFPIFACPQLSTLYWRNSNVKVSDMVAKLSVIKGTHASHCLLCQPHSVKSGLEWHQSRDEFCRLFSVSSSAKQQLLPDHAEGFQYWNAR